MIENPVLKFGVEIGDTLIVFNTNHPSDRDTIMLALANADVYTTSGWGEEAAMIEYSRGVSFRKFRSFAHMPIFKKHEEYVAWKDDQKKSKLNVVKLNKGSEDMGDCNDAV